MYDRLKSKGVTFTEEECHVTLLSTDEAFSYVFLSILFGNTSPHVGFSALNVTNERIERIHVNLFRAIVALRTQQPDASDPKEANTCLVKAHSGTVYPWIVHHVVTLL